MDQIADLLTSRQFLVMAFAAIATMATVWKLASPLLVGNTLQKRMKAVALERERIRARERERMARSDRASLRRKPKAGMRRGVEMFDLARYFGTDNAR